MYLNLKSKDTATMFLWLFLFMLPGSSKICAQKALTKSDIKGYVQDIQTGEALPYTTIILIDSNHGTMTNADGYFVLINVPVGLCSLQVQYIGYKAKIIAVNENNKSEKPAIIKVAALAERNASRGSER